MTQPIDTAQGHNFLFGALSVFVIIIAIIALLPALLFHRDSDQRVVRVAIFNREPEHRSVRELNPVASSVVFHYNYLGVKMILRTAWG